MNDLFFLSDVQLQESSRNINAIVIQKRLDLELGQDPDRLMIVPMAGERSFHGRIDMILNFISHRISNINMAKTKAKKTKSGSKKTKKK